MPKQRVAILTNFMEFVPGYSLTGIVSDQVTMLSSHGHEVGFYTNEKFNQNKPFPCFGLPGVEHKQKVPFGHLKDYRTRRKLKDEHRQLADKTAAMLETEMQEYDVVFSHDWIFTGWNLPYGMGIRQASAKLPNVKWLHWIHSVPSSLSDWWSIREYGSNHKIIYPNKTDKRRVVEQFRGVDSDVRVIPHIKDPRSWFEFCENTCDFIDAFPGIMQSDIVQVLPASSDRLEAKRVDFVIDIFGEIKKLGHSVFLVVANQWATGRQPMENIKRYERVAKDAGLLLRDEFIFTSTFRGRYKNGIPRRMLRELFQLSNVFVFPTREESFGLVVPEAAFAGVLLMLNQSLTQQLEITGHHALYAHFGAYNHAHPIGGGRHGRAEYLKEVARILLGRLRENESISTKAFCRKKYNWDALYHKKYLPIMCEATTW